MLTKEDIKQLLKQALFNAGNHPEAGFFVKSSVLAALCRLALKALKHESND